MIDGILSAVFSYLLFIMYMSVIMTLLSLFGIRLPRMKGYDPND